jgi:hypothetical protein
VILKIQKQQWRGFYAPEEGPGKDKIKSPALMAVAVHKKRECDPKKMRHHVVSHFK